MTQPHLNLTPKPEPAVLRFEPDEHRYFVDEGKGETELPGVTRVLEECRLIDFSMVPAHILLAAQQRGTRVHQAVHYQTEGELDETTVLEADLGYIWAAQAFRTQLRIQPVLLEQRIWSPFYRFAGTLDLTGEMEHKDGDGSDPILADYKTGDETQAHEVQVTMYASCLKDARKYRRMTVYLRADGTFRVKEYKPENYNAALNVGHAAVAIWHWKHAA